MSSISSILYTIYKILLRKKQLVVVIVLCLIAFSLRSYALYRDMFFGYDQGRDALEMQKIAHGDLTLIGPVTGLDGVFLGPFWYYLIFPAYLFGNWNPVFAGYEMILFAGGTVIMLYLWGKKLQMPWAGIIAGTLYTFSFQNILFSRWAANPTPLPFFALICFYLLFHGLEQKKWQWFFASGIFLGLCFQLEAANATWFFPSFILIVFLEALSKKTSRIRFLLGSGLFIALGFALIESPHALFELKHGFLITRNAVHALQSTRDVTILESLPKRIPLLFSLYGKALFAQLYPLLAALATLILFAFLKLRKKLWENRGIRILIIWFCVPLFFHAIFTGNHGNFWDYYVIAQHPVLYLSIGVAFTLLYRSFPLRKSLVVVLATALILASVIPNFLKWTEILHPYEGRFSLDMLVQETNWMIDEARGIPYGVWVYAPNAQDEPHRYIYWWVGQQRNVVPQEHVEQQPLIFLAVEDDPVFQKRHDEWIQEKMQFGKLIDKKTFGAITVYKLENTFIDKSVGK